jgi:sodium-dependent dicarboxylate transporter 2/3/5
VSEGRTKLARVGLFAGPLLAAAVFVLVPDRAQGVGGETLVLGVAGRASAALAVWMATWWLSEAIPIYATALLPLAILPLLAGTPMRAAAAPYAHPLIFLFLGGFLLARAMEKHGLHRRIALFVLSRVGEGRRSVIAGFMGVTALLSMWVSNSATAIMMLPVAVSVIEVVEGGETEAAAARDGFAVALLLGIAYAASIGGIATPIGTPPNLFLLSFLANELDRPISFVGWMAMALPLVVVFLPLSWWLLTRVLHPVSAERIEGAGERVAAARARLGALSRGERVVGSVFGVAVALWLTRPLLNGLELGGLQPLAGLTDAGIAMLAAMLLFVVPTDLREGEFTLDWQTAAGLPWGVLLLFGGGLSLATAIGANGVGELLGGFASHFAGAPAWLVVALVVAGVVFLTELTSNTATTATLVPILAAAAPGLGLDPMLLIVPTAVAASCAFMLPVATPPNAVVFSSGRVGIPEMSRAGLWLNLIGAGLVTTWAMLVA